MLFKWNNDNKRTSMNGLSRSQSWVQLSTLHNTTFWRISDFLLVPVFKVWPPPCQHSASARCQRDVCESQITLWWRAPVLIVVRTLHLPSNTYEDLLKESCWAAGDRTDMADHDGNRKGCRKNRGRRGCTPGVDGNAYVLLVAHTMLRWRWLWLSVSVKKEQIITELLVQQRKGKFTQKTDTKRKRGERRREICNIVLQKESGSASLSIWNVWKSPGW